MLAIPAASILVETKVVEFVLTHVVPTKCASTRPLMVHA